MAKGEVGSVRDGLAQIAGAVSVAMTAPDAGPLLPTLGKLHQMVIGIMQGGAGQPMGGQPGQPGMGQPQPGMPMQGAPGQQPPGPPAQGMPGAGGRGLFPNSPQPNADDLRALIGGRAGM